MLDKGQHEINNYARTATAWNNKRMELETQLHRGSFPFMTKERREELLSNPPPPVTVKGMMTRPDPTIVKQGYLYKKFWRAQRRRRRWRFKMESCGISRAGKSFRRPSSSAIFCFAPSARPRQPS